MRIQITTQKCKMFRCEMFGSKLSTPSATHIYDRNLGKQINDVVPGHSKGFGYSLSYKERIKREIKFHLLIKEILKMFLGKFETDNWCSLCKNPCPISVSKKKKKNCV